MVACSSSARWLATGSSGHEYSLFAALIVCHDLVVFVAQIVQEQLQCSVARRLEDAGAIVRELLSEHDRGR